jgi:hypothetical protein
LDSGGVLPDSEVGLGVDHQGINDIVTSRVKIGIRNLEATTSRDTEDEFALSEW